MPLDDAGTTAPRMNCAQNNPNRANASRSEIDRLTRMATANTVWAAVSRISSRWAGSTGRPCRLPEAIANTSGRRSEEHTSELQSRQYLVCRLLLEKKKK